MPKFELTARSNMSHDGCQVNKGSTITIEIPIDGIQPYNLFDNARCHKQLCHQFKEHELEPSPNSPWMHICNWEVKMVK